MCSEQFWFTIHPLPHLFFSLSVSTWIALPFCFYTLEFLWEPLGLLSLPHSDLIKSADGLLHSSSPFPLSCELTRVDGMVKGTWFNHPVQALPLQTLLPWSVLPVCACRALVCLSPSASVVPRPGLCCSVTGQVGSEGEVAFISSVILPSQVDQCLP